MNKVEEFGPLDPSSGVSPEDYRKAVVFELSSPLGGNWKTEIVEVCGQVFVRAFPPLHRGPVSANYSDHGGKYSLSGYTGEIEEPTDGVKYLLDFISMALTRNDPDNLASDRDSKEGFPPARLPKIPLKWFYKPRMLAKPPKFSKMKLGDVIDWQQRFFDTQKLPGGGYHSGLVSTGLGKYQFDRFHLPELAQTSGTSMKAIFDEQLQDYFALRLLAGADLYDYLNDQLEAQVFAYRLALHWPGLPLVSEGHTDGWGSKYEPGYSSVSGSVPMVGWKTFLLAVQNVKVR